jgi:hypothetical protein
MKKYVLLATIVGIITVIFCSIYIVGQQAIRLSANMPQIQIAEDAAQSIHNGAKLPSVLPSGEKIDISRSSASFLIIYDQSGRAVAGSGEIDGKLPVIPYGVLQNTNGTTYHAVTWVPESGVRIASVEVRANNYYVLAGRSLKEPEKLIDTIGKLTLIGYIITLLITATGAAGIKLLGREDNLI